MVKSGTPDPRGPVSQDPAAQPARAPRDDAPSQSTTPQRDQATDTVPAASESRDPSYAEQKLPHERDESAERDTSAERDEKETRPVMRQGAADAQSGQQDTDCYKATAPRFDEAHPKSR